MCMLSQPRPTMLPEQSWSRGSWLASQVKLGAKLHLDTGRATLCPPRKVKQCRSCPCNNHTPCPTPIVVAKLSEDRVAALVWFWDAPSDVRTRDWLIGWYSWRWRSVAMVLRRNDTMTLSTGDPSGLIAWRVRRCLPAYWRRVLWRCGVFSQDLMYHNFRNQGVTRQHLITSSQDYRLRVDVV